MNKYLSFLIVDDEPAIRNGIAEIIAAGIEGSPVIYQASDGKEGLKMAMEKHPSLMISDVIMPEMSGLELKRKLNEMKIDIPTIMVSGYDEFKYAKEAIKLGILNYILKPISKQELLDAIQSVKLKLTEKNINEKEILQAATEHFLMQLLTGEIKSEEEAEHGIESLSLEFSKDALTVATLSGHKEKLQMIQEQVKDSQLMSIFFNNNLVLIYQADVKFVLHEMRLLLEDHSNIIAGIGIPVTSYSKLCISYQHSLNALSYAIYYPEENILYSRHITSGSPTISPANIDTITLKNFILENDEISIKEWTDKFYILLLNTEVPPPPSFIKGMSIYVLSDIQKHLVENLHIPQESFMALNSSMLNKFYRLVDMENWMKTQLLFISRKIVPEARISNMSDIHIARKYIENNLDTIISSNDIADKLNMTPSYFSTYFKKKTGESFRNYVNRLKNDKAKEMLSMPDYTIEEISQNLGYTDYRSFHRIFKKQNGISPTAYRKKLITESVK